MENSHRFLNRRTLARLSQQHLRTRRFVDGNVAGAHRSPFQGFSTEFSEHREYTVGDDLRHLDWKVFGRTDKYYLKRYEDETNLVCHIVVDVSESMIFKSSDKAPSKLDYASEMAASLAWLVLNKQDAVSLTTFDHQIKTALPPVAGAGQLQPILSALDQVSSTEKSEMENIFFELGSRLTQRGIIVVISDFFDEASSMLKGLASLVKRQQDVIVLHVLDRAEIEFPYDSPTRFESLEIDGAQIVDPLTLREAYLSTINEYLETFSKGCRSLSIDYEQICTDEDIGVRLSKMLSAR